MPWMILGLVSIAGLVGASIAVSRSGKRADLAFPLIIVAGMVAALVAWRTRNIALTLAVGIGLVMLIDAL